MNFFESQDQARRATRWLILVYVAATALIVAGVTLVVAAAFYTLGSPGVAPTPAVLLVTAALATLLIVGATLYRTAALSVGGSRVATDMGGTLVPPDVQDPLRRRLRNIVEEMSIASGVPVPDIYVLEAEGGINAFAAGYTPADAAVAVTRGALDVLSRDELQGVIAHEFSHILNGDMRINIRMIGVLFGIMVLSIIGRVVLRGGYYSGASYSRRNRGAPAVMAIGVGLVVLGWIGVFFARLIKAAVSRQRETLADASAVQFTRQTQGIANALKKIGGYTERSYLRAADPEEISHMLFARGSRRYMSLFATHPPLIQRIGALDPSFREEDFLKVQPHPQNGHRDGDDDRAFASAAAMDSAVVPPGSQRLETADRRSIGATIGNPDAEQIGFARRLRRSIPESLYSAAHSEASAYLLTLALVLDRTGSHVERQVHLLAGQLGSERTSEVKRYYDQLMEAGPAYALPLLEIAFPALKRRPAPQLRFLMDLIRRLVETDGEIDLFEYCFYQVLVGNLSRYGDFEHAVSGKVSKREARKAALQLIRIVADKGHHDPGERDTAWRAGAAELARWASDTEGDAETGPGSVADMDRALDVLRRIDSAGRERLIQALSTTIGHDNRITVIEAELMRAICASLGCPLPPLVAANRLAPVELANSAHGAAADTPA